MLKKLLLSLLFSCLLSTASAAPQIQTFVDVQFITGGVSLEEEALIADMAKDFSLKVVNALKCGDYLNNINILIMDESNNIVLETDTNGPLLYANPPAGKYIVYASAFGERYKKKIGIKPGIQRQAVFYWPTEPKACSEE